MSVQKLENVIKEVLMEFPSIKYGICESKKSNSLYLYLKLQGTKTSMMIDNRENKKKGKLKDFVDNESIKVSIKNLCISLQQKRTDFLFSCLKYRRRLIMVS